MGGLTADQIDEMEKELAELREKLRNNGATAFHPTPEWKSLRKSATAINKKLAADKALKKRELRAAAWAAKRAGSVRPGTAP